MQAGGAERVMAQLCNHFAEQRYDVTLLTLSPITESFYALSGTVKRDELDHPSLQSRFGRFARVIARIAVLRRKIISLGPDVIISFVDLTNVTVLLATAGLKLPVIVSERIDPAAHAHRLSRIDRALRYLTYPRASRIVVQTNRAARFFDRSLVQKIVTIPNPVPPTNLTAKPDKPLSDGRFRIIGIGRLDHQKGFDVLIEGFTRLADRFPDWDVVIFGQGPDRAALLEKIDANGLAGRIHLMGVSADVASELARSHLMAFPSRYEGFPNALAEAMAIGLPAVAFENVSGVEDLVVSGQTGILVHQDQGRHEGKERPFADGLSELMTSAELRAKMGTAAKFRIRQFEPRIIFREWDQLIAATL
jgi:glycosyltransferase involved in cell wall biosynthesis